MCSMKKLWGKSSCGHTKIYTTPNGGLGISPFSLFFGEIGVGKSVTNETKKSVCGNLLRLVQ